jgi:hypothetical protein
MATFRCGECGCEEDTALCNYWSDRVRDSVPVCSACDPKIRKWHGQFPRLFGPFLVTPRLTRSPHEVLASLVGRLSDLEDGTIVRRRPAAQEGPAPGDFFSFNDPVPSYKPLAAAGQAP